MRASDEAIVVDGLVKRWPNGRGVQGISLRVSPGEVVGFLGPNGAGKTTTIRVLLGFAKATAGAARVLGKDCWMEQEEIRRSVGYVAGEARLPGNLRVGGLLGLIERLRGSPSPDLPGLYRQLELDPNEPIRTLSKGNRQKVALIAALAGRPPALVLDEPTAGLDPLLQERFLELIGAARQRGQAVLLSSHQLDEVQRACDRVALIREGLIVAEAAVEDLRAAAPRKLVLYRDVPVDVPPNLGVRAVAREGRSAGIPRHRPLAADSSVAFGDGTGQRRACQRRPAGSLPQLLHGCA